MFRPINWIRKLYSTRTRPISQKRMGCRPAIEALEERVLLNAAPIAYNLGPSSVLHG